MQASGLGTRLKLAIVPLKSFRALGVSFLSTPISLVQSQALPLPRFYFLSEQGESLGTRQYSHSVYYCCIYCCFVFLPPFAALYGSDWNRSWFMQFRLINHSTTYYIGLVYGNIISAREHTHKPTISMALLNTSFKITSFCNQIHS